MAYHPVVAELAAEVASCRSDGEYQRAGVKVGQGLFADWVYGGGDCFAIVEGVEGAAFVSADQAEAGCSFADLAASCAEAAFDFAVVFAAVEHGFMVSVRHVIHSKRVKRDFI